MPPLDSWSRRFKVEKPVERWFRMSDEVWERHANPWSVWTRFMSVPLLALAVWSRVWIGPWAWLPSLLCVLWIWINPRVFSKPRTTASWASKSVLGERFWLSRDETPINIWHGKSIGAANAVAGSGAIALAVGLVRLDVIHTGYGVLLILVGKTWFLDRMVWLYQDAVRPR